MRFRSGGQLVARIRKLPPGDPLLGSEIACVAGEIDRITAETAAPRLRQRWACFVLIPATGVHLSPFDFAPAQTDRRVSDRDLFCRVATAGDATAREQLVKRYLPLAVQLANRYSHARESADDLTQVAALGLIKAIDRYEPDRGYAFSSFAVPTILGELKRHFRDTGWAVHIPRAVQELSLRLRSEVDEFSARHGRAPTSAELADKLGEPVERIVDAMATTTAQHVVSLDAGPSGSVAAEEQSAWYERVGAEDDGYERVEWQGCLGHGLRALPARDQQILALRFEGELSQAEIAERIGCSQMHVSRLLRRALDRLRAVAEGAAA
jgi:RNA polymerase sigma-B factor